MLGCAPMWLLCGSGAAGCSPMTMSNCTPTKFGRAPTCAPSKSMLGCAAGSGAADCGCVTEINKVFEF